MLERIVVQWSGHVAFDLRTESLSLSIFLSSFISDETHDIFFNRKLITFESPPPDCSYQLCSLCLLLFKWGNELFQLSLIGIKGLSVSVYKRISAVSDWTMKQVCDDRSVSNCVQRLKFRKNTTGSTTSIVRKTTTGSRKRWRTSEQSTQEKGSKELSFEDFRLSDGPQGTSIWNIFIIYFWIFWVTKLLTFCRIS